MVGSQRSFKTTPVAVQIVSDISRINRQGACALQRTIIFTTSVQVELACCILCYFKVCCVLRVAV